MRLPRDTIERLARDRYGRLVAIVAHRTRDIAIAEDMLGEAFSEALRTWADRGVPEDPEAWLVAVARRRWVSTLRRRAVATRDAPDLALLFEELGVDAGREVDRRLELLFVCAHPSIEIGIRAPLMMQAVLGLTAEAIGSAFLVAPSTMGQRLSRAKAKIRDAGVPFEAPEPERMADRLPDVLEAIYGAYGLASDVVGLDGSLGDLRDEASYLARLTAALTRAPEALGLLSLVLHVEARRDAQFGEDGAFVPLAEQAPARWDLGLLEEAEAALRSAAVSRSPGRFQIEAAIQSVHAQRAFGATPPREVVVDLYRSLIDLAPTLGALVGYAAAYHEATGRPLAALGILDSVDRSLAERSQSYWAVRAHLLAVADREDESRQAYDRAIGLTTHPGVRAFLLDRRNR
jgi:predicted RNA polymerase sigma factor